jgi:aldehyde dehydrogenase (NAD+)
LSSASDSFSASDSVRVSHAIQPPAADRRAALDRMRRWLATHQDDVLQILTDVASHASIVGEILSSIKVLDGAVGEIATTRPPALERMAVFMPSNMILYSYVLYLAIPSLFVDRVDFRPSSHVTGQLARLHAVLAPVHELPVRLQRVSQSDFIEQAVRGANLVVFTGTYANAEEVRRQLRKDQLYVFFGQGVNPFVVSEKANVDLATSDLIRIRMYNSGQDCLGPDAIFVHEDVAEIFLATLIAKLRKATFGSRKDAKADYCPLYYSSTLDLISKYLIANAAFIKAGGTIDYSQQKLEPTVLCSTLPTRPNIVEFFAPVFNVITYESDAALAGELNKPFYRERALGASVYGNDTLAAVLRANHTVSVDTTLLEVENGNAAFGGYGPMANYIHYRGQRHIEPILISDVVARFWEGA